MIDDLTNWRCSFLSLFLAGPCLPLDAERQLLTLSALGNVQGFSERFQEEGRKSLFFYPQINESIATRTPPRDGETERDESTQLANAPPPSRRFLFSSSLVSLSPLSSLHPLCSRGHSRRLPKFTHVRKTS
jgi:hypothetical protein